jgi:hypothetical protein
MLCFGCGSQSAEVPSREPVKLLYQAGEVKAAYDAAAVSLRNDLGTDG